MDTEDSTFGQWLWDELVEREWNRSDLARRVGVEPSLVSRWVSSKATPSTTSCRKIASVLGVDADFVLAKAGHRVDDYDDFLNDLDPEVVLYFKGYKNLAPHLQQLLKEQMRVYYETNQRELERTKRDAERDSS